jgi:histidyl-tRNA synthetase
MLCFTSPIGAVLSDRPQPNRPTHRTISDLLTAAERIEKEARAKRAAEAQARHLKKMESLATREAQLWQEIVELLEQKTASAYEQAVQHLADLCDLAQHQGEQAAFQTRLNKIYRDNHRAASCRNQKKRPVQFVA